MNLLKLDDWNVKCYCHIQGISDQFYEHMIKLMKFIQDYYKTALFFPEIEDQIKGVLEMDN